MADLIFGRDQEVAEWMAGRLQFGVGKSFIPPFTTIGVAGRSGQIIGGLLFNNFTGWSIELTIVAPGLLSAGLLRAIFSYAFDQLGCARMTMTARAKNTRHIKVAQRIGFTVEGVLRRQFGDDDGVVLGILSDEVRY